MVLGRLYDKFKSGLRKTREAFEGLGALLGLRVDQSFLDRLEAMLLRADVGVEATEQILARVRQAFADREAGTDLLEFVKAETKAMLGQDSSAILFQPTGTTVIMIAGVNGSGKTTSIAKLATRLKAEGRSVLLGACDTFRAAAIEQLALWAERTGTDIVKGTPGSDPAAVAFDACTAAVARQRDVAIIDTAGRLHTQGNLMRELEKIHRVIGKAIPGAPHEVLLVLDSTNGQNAIRQAEEFTKVIRSTGIILTKVDGTAKGGSIVAIRRKLQLPVKFLGVGEKPEDLEVFDPDTFVEALFATD